MGLLRGDGIGVRVGVIGGSGYVGGELLRLLILHPAVDITTVVSRQHAGEYVFRVHPNLRKATDLKFTPLEISNIAEGCDIVFTATPHGASVRLVPKLLEAGLRVIDTSADFRLKDPSDYERWYGWKHGYPELLEEAVYGLPELHREGVKTARLVACPGCMAVASILGLAPVVKTGAIEGERIVVDAKIGSSGAGAKPTSASHHAERFGGVRPYSPVAHRHTAEIEQELNLLSDEPIRIMFTAHAVNMVRGILCTIHTFPKRPLTPLNVWRMYRPFYGDEPFVRIVKDSKGLHRLPDPKVTLGTNFCDVGFELDSHANRLVVLSAIDNLVRGAAGQAVQCLNIMLGLDERTGLESTGFHPM